jgi:NADPH:quinone reductase-like Zn-dependent oxidoreductase
MTDTTTMRALVIDRTGGPDELHLAEVPVPTRVSDELLVRVVAAGVNPIDAKTRAGRGVSRAIERFPAVLGADFAGVVEKVPYSAHPLQPGDRVYGMGRVPRVAGSYAEVVSVSSLSVTRMPASLDFAHAAGVPTAALTAWGAIVDTARVHDGQRVLIHAGAGGVGHFAVQFARYFGAVVTATCSEQNAWFVQELGAQRVIDYTSERFEKVVSGQDVVIDLIGNVHDETATRSLDVLRPGGLIVTVPTGSWPTMAEDAAARGMRATGYSVAPDARTLSVITRLIDDGALRVHVDRELPLAEGAEAHRMIEDGHVRGKVVLRVSSDPA